MLNETVRALEIGLDCGRIWKVFGRWKSVWNKPSALKEVLTRSWEGMEKSSLRGEGEVRKISRSK
jgi:hypothetical protein